VTSSPAALSASAIVRSRDKADTIEQTLSALRAQTVPVEIVVVDSGSVDGTLEIARRYADEIVEIPPEEFSYGGTLNIGSSAAHGDIHFPLSAHSVPMTNTWIADALRHYDDDRVAATNGVVDGPDGRRVEGPCRPSLSEALANPAWGFSNHAGSWRASVVREHPFRTDLTACEDKEWFWRVLQAGYVVVFDPALHVPSTHRRDAGVRALWERNYKEARALAQLGHPPVRGLRDTMDRWSRDFSYPSRWPSAVRFLSPLRVAEQLGTYFGSRAGGGRAPSAHAGV
jgi:rhamnosyltransferase